MVGLSFANTFTSISNAKRMQSENGEVNSILTCALKAESNSNKSERQKMILEYMLSSQFIDKYL